MKIVPAIDIIDGKCVRLTQGDYNAKKIYNENPLEVAKDFEVNGIRYLHLVDLDGAKAGRVLNWNIIEQIATNTNLNIDFGGGIKSDEDIELAFESGAKQVTCGSIAVKNPDKVMSWAQNYGSEKIIIGADVRNKMVAVSGWMEQTEMTIDTLINQYLPVGLNQVICTDISVDGTLAGPAIALYKELLNQFPIKLTASGGIGSITDLKKLNEIGVEGVIIGKAIYEGKISLNELKPFLNA